MPFNLLKKYNALLELNGFNSFQRKKSLKGIFDRDIANNDDFSFRGKAIKPTSIEGVLPMETLFTHLTKVIADKKTKQREYDNYRSERLHWLLHHINERESNLLVFSAEDKAGVRTYIYDEQELYVIVLEPRKNKDDYFLLSAYHLRGKKKFTIKNKYKRRLKEVL